MFTYIHAHTKKYIHKYTHVKYIYISTWPLDVESTVGRRGSRGMETRWLGNGVQGGRGVAREGDEGGVTGRGGAYSSSTPTNPTSQPASQPTLSTFQSFLVYL